MDEDELILVSSLYGKGTTLCWLLTILACLISWTCDKRKRKSDSLNADFVGIHCLPCVAAGHTLHQIRSLGTLDFTNTRPITIIQISRAIEASLTLTETFMILSVVLFLVAFPARCYKRAALIAATSLLCLATEYCVYKQLTISPTQELQAIKDNFTRSFVSDSAIILTVVLVLVLTCIAIAFCLAWYIFYWTSRRPVRTTSEETETIARMVAEIERLHTPDAILPIIEGTEWQQIFPTISAESRFMKLSAYVSMIFLPGSFLASFTAMYFGPHGLSAGMPEYSDWWSGLVYVAQRFLFAFFPKTTAGFADLDQAVAVATGCFILALCLWTIVRKWYLDWKYERESLVRLRRKEEIRLRELQRRFDVLVQDEDARLGHRSPLGTYSPWSTRRQWTHALLVSLDRGSAT